MARERILITVKTYPTLSATYGELVCTAGLRKDGSWIRIYPIPFRRLEDFQKFEKYRIVEADVTRNWKDSRPESHRVDFQSLQLTDELLPTEDAWRERRRWVLDRGTVYDDLTELIEAANQKTTSPWPLSNRRGSRVSESSLKTPNGTKRNWTNSKQRRIRQKCFRNGSPRT